jgi:hypothetical protein
MNISNVLINGSIVVGLVREKTQKIVDMDDVHETITLIVIPISRETKEILHPDFNITFNWESRKTDPTKELFHKSDAFIKVQNKIQVGDTIMASFYYGKNFSGTYKSVTVQYLGEEILADSYTSSTAIELIRS